MIPNCRSFAAACNAVAGTLCFLLLCVPTAGAQASRVGAALEGTVSDSSSARIPQAAITFRNTETNQSRVATTDGQGFFRADELAVGTYEVRLEHPGFAPGDCVYGVFGVQEYAVSDGSDVLKLDTALAPPTTYLGALGMTGLTAYFALLDVGKIRAGETVVISGAAGAVGSLAGQIAKLKGCRAIGIAGGQEKCSALVQKFGFDAAIDYKTENLRRALREHAPGGVDVYLDNVGGDVLDAVLTRLARGARVIICGAVSQYNADRVQGPANYLMLLVARASMTGMVIFDYQDRFPQATADLARWFRDGQIVSREHIVRGGVGDFPEALLKLFAGENTGKLILALDNG